MERVYVKANDDNIKGYLVNADGSPLTAEKAVENDGFYWSVDVWDDTTDFVVLYNRQEINQKVREFNSLFTEIDEWDNKGVTGTSYKGNITTRTDDYMYGLIIIRIIQFMFLVRILLLLESVIFHWILVFQTKFLILVLVEIILL